MGRKLKAEIQKENEELRTQLAASVTIVKDLKSKIDSLETESQDEPLSVCPRRNLYGVDSDGNPVQGRVFSLGSNSRRKVAHGQGGYIGDLTTSRPNKRQSEADKKLRELAVHIREHYDLLRRARKAIDSVDNEALARGEALLRAKKNRGLSVGEWDQNRKGWNGDLPPEEHKAMNDALKPLSNAKISIAGPRQTFSSSKDSVWDGDLKQWREGNQIPQQDDLSVGEWSPEKQEWVGRKVNRESGQDAPTSWTEMLIPPNGKCPKNVPKLGAGIMPKCIYEHCDYLRWCQSRGRPLK